MGVFSQGPSQVEIWVLVQATKLSCLSEMRWVRGEKGAKELQPVGNVERIQTDGISGRIPDSILS